MKKILFATTALVASTSFAMADVDLSGSAEMGIFGGDNIEDQFHTDIDVTFSMSGETDGGLTFGASVDLDESIGDGGDATDNDADDGGATIFVSGSLGTLTMGDTDGALDWAMSEAIIGGTLQDDHEHVGYSGNSGLDGTYDGQVARYDYSFGDFGVAVSAEISDVDLATDDDVVFGLGFSYNTTFGAVDLGLGLGYQTANDADIIGVSADMGFANGLRVILNYSDLDDAVGVPFDGIAADSHAGIAIGYSTGALLVAMNYGVYDLTGGGEDEGVGLVANYDLGGGASLQAGYGYNDPEGVDSFDTYSFGISMSF